MQILLSLTLSQTYLETKANPESTDLPNPHSKLTTTGAKSVPESSVLCPHKICEIRENVVRDGASPSLPARLEYEILL